MVIPRDQIIPVTSTTTPWLGLTDTPSHRERDDTYHGEIVELGSRWRVVICKNRIQWILQRRSKNPPHRGYWRGRSFFTSRDALLEACASRGLLSDPKVRAVLEVLPEQISGIRK